MRNVWVSILRTSETTAHIGMLLYVLDNNMIPKIDRKV